MYLAASHFEGHPQTSHKRSSQTCTVLNTQDTHSVYMASSYREANADCGRRRRRSAVRGAAWFGRSAITPPPPCKTRHADTVMWVTGRGCCWCGRSASIQGGTRRGWSAWSRRASGGATYTSTPHVTQTPSTTPPTPFPQKFY